MRAAVTVEAGFIEERLAAFGGDEAVTEGTILDANALDAAFTGCKVVFPEAALEWSRYRPAFPMGFGNR